MNETTKNRALWTGLDITPRCAMLGIEIERTAPSKIAGKDAVIRIAVENAGRGRITAKVRLSKAIPEGSVGEQWCLAHEMAHFLDHCPLRSEGGRRWVRGFRGYAHYSGKFAAILRKVDVAEFLSGLTPVTIEVRPRLNGSLVSAETARASPEFTPYQRSKLAVREIQAAVRARGYKNEAKELFAEGVACFWVHRNVLQSRFPVVADMVSSVLISEGITKN